MDDVIGGSMLKAELFEDLKAGFYLVRNGETLMICDQEFGMIRKFRSEE